MRTKSILISTVLAIGLFFALKSCLESNSHDTPASSEVQPETREIRTTTFPISYSIGELDSRFGISRDHFLQIVEQAKRIWEFAADKDLLEYKQDAAMKINLIYDWRQERLIATKERKARLDENGKSFNLLITEYSERLNSIELRRSTYQELAQAYKSRLDEYDSRAVRWNEGANRTNEEHIYLQRRKQELEDEAYALEQKRIELNTNAEELARLADRINTLARQYNLEVENFNGTLVETREFDKGFYDGSAITIYEFEKEEDLKITLVHEFGHALGLGHVDNPRSIMHQRLGAQDMNDIRLTSDDIALLRARLK